MSLMKTKHDRTSTFILLFMAFLACFTITQYCFQHDNYLVHKDDDTRTNVTFLYGAPNAEFDWCERNFLWSNFIAEPVNTFTGLFFIFLPILGELLHLHISLPFPAHLTLIFSGLIGVGTILFHATLRYWAQLLDELPIYYLILLVVLELSNNDSTLIRTIITLWAFCLSFLLFYLPQENFSHEIVRGCMSTSFTLCFVYTFYKISSRVNAMKEIKPERVNNESMKTFKKQVQELFHYSFIFFVIAELCWLIDNSSCALLRTLPFYPHLHAIWHIFASSGMHGLFMCVVALKWLPRNDQMEIYWCYGILPRIQYISMVQIKVE
jgi:dihydroceramidase